MASSYTPSRYMYVVIILFVGIKLLIHSFAIAQYGLHRDEYLYIQEGHHLSWGYMEGPPMIGLIASISQMLDPDIIIVRLFPVLIGVASVFIIGVWVREMGGSIWATAFACGAFVFSPAFLGSNHLFQPVSFNQFFWLLSGYFFTRILRKGDQADWYYLGIVAGLGLMTKYSLAFFLTAWGIAFLLTPHRKWFKTRYPYIAAGIALLITSPNIVWQFQHHLPVVSHMKELAATQLVNVSPSGFILFQFLAHLSVSVVWVSGLIYALFTPRMHNYRAVGFAYLSVIAILLLLSGKPYYAFGSYAMLFVLGGITLEKWIKPAWGKYALALIIILQLLPIYPYALPILPISTAEKYYSYMYRSFGLEANLRWEDGVLGAIPQDFADMHGWDEMSQKVAQLYHSLPQAQQKNCLIYGGSYGHAAALNYFRQSLAIPETYSLDASLIMWVPANRSFSTFIAVEDTKIRPSVHFENQILVDSVTHPYARDPGYIYLKTLPKVDVDSVWRELVLTEKSRYGF